MERRASRRKTSTKKYTVDAFEGVEGFEGDELGPPIPSLRDDDDDDGDDDDDDDSDVFAEPEGDADEDEEEDEDVEMSELDAEAEDDSDVASDAGERDLDDKISIASDPDDVDGIDGEVRRIRLRATKDPNVDEAFIRGVPEGIATSNSRDARRLFFFGPAASDYEPIHKARQRWAYEPCLPSRGEDKDGNGGFHESYFKPEETRAREAVDGWQWHYEQGGKTAFAKRQVLANLSADQGKEYMPSTQGTEVSFVMGALKSSKMFKLQAGQAVPLREAWEPNPPQTTLPSGYKTGFVLNLGAKVHCLEWGPNQPGKSQYLAAAVSPQRSTADPPFEAESAPAFTAQEPCSSSIQIWEFTANSDGYIDRNAPPKLRLVLCMDWGDAKELKWCPMSREVPTDEDDDCIGFLAGVWCDGGLRVLKVPRPLATGTTYLKVEKAALTSHPPNTIFTCLSWLSPSRLAAGCANGSVAIYSLPDCLRSNLSNARPKLFTPLSVSYISTITTAYPSHPNMLLTSSIDGYLRLTDLSRPNPSSHVGTLQSSRYRASQTMVLWDDFSQCALSCDDNFSIKGHPLRRFFGTVSLARSKSLTMAMAVSPCHPFVLIGGAGGEVFGTNPMRRVTDGKAGIWQQPWFVHEWRRPTTAEIRVANERAGSDENGASNDLKGIGTRGLSRFTEGYKVERANLFTSETGNVKYKNLAEISTLHEEETGVSALSWNPNLHVGGWAAAGLVDGLVRVEDIAA